MIVSRNLFKIASSHVAPKILIIFCVFVENISIVATDGCTTCLTLILRHPSEINSTNFIFICCADSILMVWE